MKRVVASITIDGVLFELRAHPVNDPWAMSVTKGGRVVVQMGRSVSPTSWRKRMKRAAQERAA